MGTGLQTLNNLCQLQCIAHSMFTREAAALKGTKLILPHKLIDIRVPLFNPLAELLPCGLSGGAYTRVAHSQRLPVMRFLSPSPFSCWKARIRFQLWDNCGDCKFFCGVLCKAYNEREKEYIVTRKESAGDPGKPTAEGREQVILQTINKKYFLMYCSNFPNTQF